VAFYIGKGVLMMEQYGVVLTDNFNNGKVIDFLRFETEEEAEKVYQGYKRQNVGVVKVKIEKAHEFRAVML
jgi:hypothetical protein